MKKLLLAFLLLPGAVQAQIAVNGVSLDSLKDLKLIQVIVYSREHRRDQGIVVDYGQKKEDVEVASRVTFGKNRESKQIRSAVEAMNIFENNGWEYVDTIAYPTGSTASFPILYLTFRRKPSGK